MAGQQIDIVANLLMKVDGAEAGINKLKNSLSKLKMPEGLENSFKKSFANLDVIFARYRSQVEKGFSTKADVTNFAKTGKALDAELDRISKHFTELTGKQIDFKVNSAEITKTEQELTKLINQRNELAKSSVKFEITGAKEGYKDIESLLTKLKEVAGNTKTGQYAAGALDFLKQGDLQNALALLDKASVSCKRLNEEKQKTFSATGLDMSTAIKKIVEELTGAEGKFGNVNTKVTEFERILADLRTGQIKDAGDLAQRLADDMLDAGTAAKQANGAMQDFAQSSFSMTQQLGQLQQSTQYFFSLRNMINLFKRGVDEAIQSVKELDAAMTETAVVTDYKVSDMWNMLPQYTQLANQLGATTQGAYETMTLYFQQGLDQQQAFELGAETMKMARIAGLDYAETTDMMTAALRGFNMELNETSAKRVNDVYSELAAITASDTEELGTAMQRTASIAHSAGSSFEGTTAFLAQAIETTREPAENIGTAMKTIIARFQEMKKNPLEISEVEGEEVDFNKIDAALKTIGVDLVDTNGQFRDFDKVMLEISQKWDTLSQSQQRYIATTAAGSRQQSRFIAMVSDYDRTMQLMEAANNSAGASDEQFGKTMDSLESKLNKLHNAWQQFTMGIANNGMIKFAVDGTTKLLSGVNSLIDTFSLGSGTIKSFLSLFTAFTGLKASGKIMNSLIGGLGGMVDPTSTFSAGFGRGITGNRQAVNAAQAAAIYQPIVNAIHEASNKEIQNENTRNKVGAYDQYNAFKQSNQALRNISGNKKSFTASDIIGELNKTDKTTQRKLMRSMAGTEMTLTQSLLGRYKDSGKNSYKGILQTKNQLRGMRNTGEISDADYFEALFDPRKLLQYVDSSNGPGEAAKAYLENISSQIKDKSGPILEDMYRDYEQTVRNSMEGSLEEDILDTLQTREEFKADKTNQRRAENEAVRQVVGSEKSANKKGADRLDKIGKVGAGVSQFGMAIQGFSSLLMNSANPAVQTFGSLLNSIGTGISSLGMGISGLTSAFTAISGSNFITGITGAGTALGGLGITANMLTGGLMLLVGVIAGVALAIKKHRDNIREDAEKVTTDYKEKNEKHQSNISTLESYREDFARLSAGVDSNGMNINLDTADYERYLEITRALADINPDIVDGYNAQGNAIISNKNALEDTLALEKERQAETFDTYISPDSTNTLLKARDLSRIYKEVNTGVGGEYTSSKTIQGFEFAPQADMRKQAKEIGENLQKGIKEGWVDSNILKDFKIDIDDLAEGSENAISAFEQNYDKIKARISSTMDSAGDELKDSTKESMLDAFSGYNEAADELDELITPLYEQTLAKVGKEIQVPAEFKSFLNQGIKDIVSDANITDIDGEIAKLTTSFSALGEEGSEYSKILEDVEIAQDKYAASLDANTYDEFVHGTNGAVERIQALKDELLDGIDTTQGYGKAVSEFLDNEINKIEDFTKAGAANLQQALNTMTSEIEAAEGVLENFNKIAEGSTYGKAASNMSQIFETATADEHALGQGDQAFWAGAEALVGRKNLLEGGGTNTDKALKQMKEVQEMLKGGQEGWDNFKIKWFDSADAKLFEDIKGLKLDDSGWISEIDESINPQVYDQIADKLNMSKESLIAMLNLGRQFGEISFTNIEDVRKALATSESTIKNSNTGAVFVKQESLEAEMTSAGLDLNKQQEVEKDLQDNYNTQLIKSADEITKTNNQFAAMGIDSMESLVKTFDDTGQFTKDEIQEYAEKWAEFNGQEGELANFDKYWQNNQEDTEFGGIPSSLDSIESILSAIQSILASQRLSEGYLDNTTADASKKWLFGDEGEDTAAQKFWKGHGSGANGEITTSEFNQTSKELTDFIAKGKDYIDQLDKVQPANETERKQIEAEKEAYEYQVSRAETYLKEGTEAYNTQVQSKIDAINQDKEVIDRGFADLLGSITPESINTDAAQSTLNQLYDAAINNTPAILTDGLKAQMESLGIDIQKAIDAGLIVDENGILTSAQKTGQDTAQAGVEGNISGQQGVDTTPAETAGEQKGKETGEAGVQGNASGQSSVVPTAVQHAEEYDNRGGSSQPEVAPKVDTSQIDEADEKVNNFKAKLSEGADFNINVTGANDLNKAALAADKVAKNSGNKTVGVTTTFDSSVATAGVASLNAMNAKIKVGADTSTALTQAENARKTIDNKKATIDVSINQTGNRTVSITVKKSGSTVGTTSEHLAKGKHNHGYFASPSFGSAAKGNYGQLGPKGKGGLTLTGELGYEVAWIPSENRSMILGANGPQMINLPGDAVVWDHEQSKQIVKQKTIPAGSHYVTGKDAVDPRSAGRGNGGNSYAKQVVKNAKEAGDKTAKAAEDTAKAIGRVLVWWDNAARRATEIQRKTDKNQKTYEKYLKEMQATLKSTGTVGQGDSFIANTQKLISEQQTQYSKAMAELASLDSGGAAKTNKGRKKQYNAGADNIVQISYKKGKKTKTAYMNTASYIYQDANGAYQIDQNALNSVKNADQRKALADALNKEINDRISKRNAAEDAIEKAQEALEKFAEELYQTFFAWEVELTKIWNLTQKIEATENNISRIKTYEETLNKQISTGLAKSNDLERVDQTIQLFKQGLEASTNKLQTQVDLIEEQKKALQDAISIEDERTTLASVQTKLNQRQELDNKAAQKGNELNIAQANLTNAQQQAAAKQAQIADLKKKKKKESNSNKKKKIQAQIDAAKAELNTINGYIDNYAAQVNQATAEYNQAVADATANLNDTEKLAYEQYAKELKDQIQTQTMAQKYLTVKQLGDGTVEVQFATKEFEKDKLEGNITTEQGKAIQDYVKKIEETSGNLSDDAYKNANTTVNELYDQLEQLQNDWVGYANELWDIHDKEVKTETDNFKKLSDSIDKALKNLLDEIKRKLDERRKQEDNVKTERDISQKQQRLAALRADTAGGHQVEIAQLEREIADAQQNYQRTLEDQLLDKLQQQADLAAQQRERQIELQEAIAEGVNNAALVDLWMSNPAAYRDEIYEAYKAANDYDKKPEALRKNIDRNFESLMLGLTTNQKKQEAVINAIDSIQDTIDKIKDSLEWMSISATNAKSKGKLVTEAHERLGLSYAELKQQGGYDATDFEKAGLSYEETREAFTVEEIEKQGAYKSVMAQKAQQEEELKQAEEELKQAEAKLESLKSQQAQSTSAFYWLDRQGHKVKVQDVQKSRHQDSLKRRIKKTERHIADLQEILSHYATGGLADYTGPAWLDGTPSKPELVLNAKDTQNFLALKDILSKVIGSTNSISNSYGGDNIFEININVDKIEKDYDVDRVAERVKKKILDSSSYRNVTQVRNFR